MKNAVPKSISQTPYYVITGYHATTRIHSTASILETCLCKDNVSQVQDSQEEEKTTRYPLIFIIIDLIIRSCATIIGLNSAASSYEQKYLPYLVLLAFYFKPFQFLLFLTNSQQTQF